jgi:transposase InsO family protein
MPWKERTAVEERKSFIEEWQLKEDNLAELCRKYGISRQTGYKWLKRFETQGEHGLLDLSRAPRQSPQAMSDEVASELVQLRQQHPRWGPRKLRSYQQIHHPDQHWPALSSIGELLKREGLVQSRRKRRRTPRYSEPLAHAQAPNQVWCADFKGWFVCGDGKRCDPLTISDAYSRYLLRCQAVAKTDGIRARSVFEAVFRECGLPDAIRTDNGAPFAGPTPAGLSRLSMWWIRLGIGHERIEPGCPQQNGRHERMHQTLKQETANPPAANLRRQQRAMLDFQREYNLERPHEALGYQTPGSLYVASARSYPARLPEPEYPAGSTLRSISRDGQMRWTNERVFLSKVLAGEQVGLLQVEDAFYEVYYGPVLLGWYDEAENFFVADAGRPDKQRRRKQKRELSAQGAAPSLFPSL